MAQNISRSQNASLVEGATDGKYRKSRPDTEAQPGMGVEKVLANRASLNPFYNYGFTNDEYETMQNPGA